jgi:signal peptidase I
MSLIKPICSLQPIMPKLFLSRPRYILSEALTYCLIISSVFMLWKSLCLITNSPSPVIVVISESMEPAFQKGDLLFLWNRDESVKVGDIAVCWFKGRDLPMVHRVVQKFPLLVGSNAGKRYAYRISRLPLGVPIFERIKLTGI